MVSRVKTVAFSGLEATQVDVEVHITNGLPSFQIVGLPDKAVSESKERIRSSFYSIGLAFPMQRITVNMAPASLMKEGSHYDLSIALCLLVELKIIPQEKISDYIVLGELSLDGSLNKVSGILPASIFANSIENGVICPQGNGAEAVWSGNRDILAPNMLLEVINHMQEKQFLTKPEISKSDKNQDTIFYPDLKDVKGHKKAKRALEIAAAGGHNMMMIGPPGSGKSMLASRIPGILPDLTLKEMLEISTIASIAGKLTENENIIKQRPFRDPHSSSSLPSLIGGGRNATPGEITLSHLGVLFLDELPEFARNTLEALRQPVESGSVSIARVNAHVKYPARFQLIAAMNPCKCGYFGENYINCSKMPKCAEDYQGRISGPLLDRFDIRIEVPIIQNIDIYDADEQSEPSKTVAERVMVARKIQSDRYKECDFSTNAYADGEILKKHTQLSEEGKNLMRTAIEKMHLSMRGVNKILKVSRTIADLDRTENINTNQLKEALGYRMFNNKSRYSLTA